MKKNKLAVLPLLVGIAFLIYSWFESYPLSIDYPGDFVFNHISFFYWLSLPLILGSLYVLGVFSKNHSFKCLVSIAVILTIYSISFFYSSMPTADSQFFRGLTEYFLNTNKLDASYISHYYYQWPSYFLLAGTVTSLSGLNVIGFEFLFYAIIGVLLSMTLYIYASKYFKNGAFFAVISFFISMYWFLNYQSVPFSFALALTFLLFMFELQKKSAPALLIILVLFFCISFTHFFVSLFFIFYLILRSIIGRSKQYAKLSLMTLTIYLVTQLSFTSWNWIKFNLGLLVNSSPEYGVIVETTLKPIIIPFDILAQNISRTVTIVTIAICLFSYVFLVIKRKFRVVDTAILLSGLAYLALGFIFYTLGSRALTIFFIPICLGVAFLFETKFRIYIKGIFLVLLVLWVFVPIHTSYNSYIGEFIPFQTYEVSNAENFLVNHYNWTTPGLMLVHAPIRVYLSSVLDPTQVKTTFPEDISSVLFPEPKEYNGIFYTVGLGNDFLIYNYTLDELVSEGQLSVLYTNGLSEIAIKSSK
ncbi:MAG: hypothetical protein NWE95_04480 [Candidatus Bathyarchaeota archaeon]|nr:hypothetical protein [Candidatus Bathyarchaeota archaeon]